MKNLKKTLASLFVAAFLVVTVFANNGGCPPVIYAGGYTCYLVVEDAHVCAYQCY